MLWQWMVGLIKTMRPKQWAKNGFVFVALIFDQQLTYWDALGRTAAGFVIFCLLSSTVYIINDLVDLEADRLHPRKRFRPLAAGKMPKWVAYTAITVLILFTFPLSYWLSPTFTLIATVYFGVNLAYSFWLKHVPLLDVFILAGFYVLRVAAGVELIEVTRFSPWLYVFTTFFALFLGIGKRRAELALLAGDANAHRRVFEGYTIPYLDQLTIIVSGGTIITYSLYTFSAPNMPANHAMMLTIPFVIYGLFRYLYLLQVKNTGAAPEDVLFSDRPLQLSLVLWGLVILAVFYFQSR